MLQISLPILGDKLDIFLPNNLDNVLLDRFSASLENLFDAAKTHLDWFDLKSGLRKLDDSQSLSEIEIPQIVTLYTEFWLTSKEFSTNDFDIGTSTDFWQPMILEKSVKLQGLGSQLLLPFLILCSLQLADSLNIKVLKVQSRYWGFAQQSQNVTFPNPLTDSEVEFSLHLKGFLLDFYDHKSKSSYILFSESLLELAKFQVQTQQKVMASIALASFAAEIETNRIWQLDSDNLAHLLDA